jgi:UDP-galactopyranose mutase
MVDYLIVGARFAGAVMTEQIAAVLGKRAHVIEAHNKNCIAK